MPKERLIEDSRVVCAAVSILAFLVLLTFTTGVWAGLISKSPNGDWARLNKGSCTNDGILKHIPEQYRDKFGPGEAGISGTKFQLCWVLAPDGSVILVYEDGETGKIPLRMFKPEDES